MTVRSYEATLRETIAPGPDPEARLVAKRAALEEFERVRALPSRPAYREAEAPEISSDVPQLPARGEVYGVARVRRSVLANLLAGVAAAGITALGLTSVLWPSFDPGMRFESAPLNVTMLVSEQAPSYSVALPAMSPPPLKMEVASLGMTFAQDELTGRDTFPNYTTNGVKRVAADPVSTFSVDVDTASYSFVRRMLTDGALPEKDAVRAEEMINYFDYSWPGPQSPDVPFKATVAVGDSPWSKGRKLIHIGIKGYDLPPHEEPHANLVLLLDVSGSMESPDRLPLVKKSMSLLVSRLKPDDTVAIVTYAGDSGVVLEPTAAREQAKIQRALQTLEASGSTAGAAGIERAYDLAQLHFRQDGVNRILLATDGDFNVGISDVEDLKALIASERDKGVFLSVLGFGEGNYQDSIAQALAQNGNGVAAYIDTLEEARRVLVRQATSSLFTIAKDVKIQVEFNPATVADYRLVGYETRALAREDFENDTVDAGDIGSGHTVTAIYEITPVGVDAQPTEERRYAPVVTSSVTSAANANEYAYLRIRYKLPDGQQSRLIEQAIPVNAPPLPASVARDVKFSTAVAGFAQLLRGDKYTGALTYKEVIRQAESAEGDDPDGLRAEFVELVKDAQQNRSHRQD